MPAQWLAVRQAVRAGVRKPPREETALKGTSCRKRYGDLSAAGVLADLDRAGATNCSTLKRVVERTRARSRRCADPLARDPD
jgi:hypothetical protein